MSTLPEAIILFIVALALFIISIVADRMFYVETPSKWSFSLSLLSLYLALLFLISNLFVGMPPPDVPEGFLDFMNSFASEWGGWSIFFGVNYLCFATATGMMTFLARFVDSVDHRLFGFGAIGAFAIGIIFLTGFFDFFKAISLILGIVATIIGILVGIKKLSPGKLEGTTNGTKT